jgi:hypothetical protein
VKRVIEPEWLDELPADNARAIASRADLRRLNWFMGHAHIISDVLCNLSAPERVIDLGAGDAAMSLALLKRLGWRDTEFVLVDRCGTISEDTRASFNTRQCTVTLRQCDVLRGLNETGVAEIAFANLFLHHFTEAELIRLLGEAAPRCDLFVACEPRRSPLALLGSRGVALLGCNAVTRHDAVASVRAGFRGSELSQLWPHAGQWALTERAAGLFSHLFVARRL